MSDYLPTYILFSSDYSFRVGVFTQTKITSEFLILYSTSVVKVKFLLMSTASFEINHWATAYLVLFVKAWLKEGITLVVPKFDLVLANVTNLDLNERGLSSQYERS